MIGHLRTTLKLAAGFAALAIGIVLSLPGIPGPGILTILVGLWLLSDHFEWARKMLVWTKERLDQWKQKRSEWRRGAAPPVPKTGETNLL